MQKKYLTPKCNHNERGRCINCLNNRLKMEKELARSDATEKPRALFESKGPQPSFNKCNHGLGAKCINCLPRQSIIIQKCHHSPVIKCSHCIEKQFYTTFRQYIQKLELDCTHNKPCPQCTPPQKMHYFVDRSCRRHLPYPQAMCNLCMPPVVSVGKQSYTHVKEVKFLTFDVFKAIQKRNFLGFLYGSQNDRVIEVRQLYFPGFKPDSKTGVFNIFEDKNESNVTLLAEALGMKLVGMIYDSVDLLHSHLSLSAHYQQMNKAVDCNTQISRFVTVRIIRDPETYISQGIQCFMVSDQFQTFQRNSLTYPLPHHNEFGLQVAMSKYDNLPTYLRGGIQTDRIQFGECMVWVSLLLFLDNLSYEQIIQYPLHNLETQRFADFEQYVQIMKTIIYIFRYRNLQFLLHLIKIKGLPFVYNLVVCDSQDEMLKMEREIENFIIEQKSRRTVEELKKKQPNLMQYNKNSKNPNPMNTFLNPYSTAMNSNTIPGMMQTIPNQTQINQRTNITPQNTAFFPNNFYPPNPNPNSNPPPKKK